MTLSAMFNATADKKERLDTLELLLDILHDQKTWLTEDRTKIKGLEKRIAYWKDINELAELELGGPLPEDSIAAGVLRSKNWELEMAKNEALEHLGGQEQLLARHLSGIFAKEGMPEKLSAFFTTADTVEPDKALVTWAKQHYYHLKELPLDPELPAIDIAKKLINPRRLARQIDQVNALIDEGSIINKAKRIAWQIGKAVSQ